jgi:hypothetical protein
MRANLAGVWDAGIGTQPSLLRHWGNRGRPPDRYYRAQGDVARHDLASTTADVPESGHGADVLASPTAGLASSLGF